LARYTRTGKARLGKADRLGKARQIRKVRQVKARHG
jgi:hypothetical protein